MADADDESERDMQLTPAQVLDLLPQQRPFRFVDEILEVDEQRIVGRYTFREDEWFYAGHFPGRPITPGVILLESMCQVGVVALGIYLFALEHSVEEARQWTTLFVEAESEFLRSVLPGETVTIRGERDLLAAAQAARTDRDVRGRRHARGADDGVGIGSQEWLNGSWSRGWASSRPTRTASRRSNRPCARGGRGSGSTRSCATWGSAARWAASPRSATS